MEQYHLTLSIDAGMIYIGNNQMRIIGGHEMVIFKT